MTQVSLDFAPRRDETGAESIGRVRERIAGHVLVYCRICLGSTFRMEQLAAFVADRGERVAPDSAGRILRDLRQKGAVEYTLLSRRDSLYRCDWVRP